MAQKTPAKRPNYRITDDMDPTEKRLKQREMERADTYERWVAEGKSGNVHSRAGAKQMLEDSSRGANTRLRINEASRNPDEPRPNAYKKSRPKSDKKGKGTHAKGNPVVIG